MAGPAGRCWRGAIVRMVSTTMRYAPSSPTFAARWKCPAQTRCACRSLGDEAMRISERRCLTANCSGCHGKNGVGGDGPALSNKVFLIQCFGHVSGRDDHARTSGTVMQGFSDPSPIRPVLDASRDRIDRGLSTFIESEIVEHQSEECYEKRDLKTRIYGEDLCSRIWCVWWHRRPMPGAWRQ